MFIKKTYFNLGFLIILISFIFSCSSSIEVLKKEVPYFYEFLIKDKIFIISNKEYGKVIGDLKFYENGTLEINGIGDFSGNWMWNWDRCNKISKSSRDFKCTIVDIKKNENSTENYLFIIDNLNNGVVKINNSYLKDSNKYKLLSITKQVSSRSQEYGDFLVTKNLNYFEEAKKNKQRIVDKINKAKYFKDKVDIVIQSSIENKNEYFYQNIDKKMLDDKVLADLNKNFPNFKKYFEQEFYYEGKATGYKFFELFKLPVLTKMKMAFQYDFVENDNGITINYDINNIRMYILFNIHKQQKKLILSEIRAGMEKVPSGQHLSFLKQATLMDYPNYDYLDADFLDTK